MADVCRRVYLAPRGVAVGADGIDAQGRSVRAWVRPQREVLPKVISVSGHSVRVAAGCRVSGVGVLPGRFVRFGLPDRSVRPATSARNGVNGADGRRCATPGRLDHVILVESAASTTLRGIVFNESDVIEAARVGHRRHPRGSGGE